MNQVSPPLRGGGTCPAVGLAEADKEQRTKNKEQPRCYAATTLTASELRGHDLPQIRVVILHQISPEAEDWNSS